MKRNSNLIEETKNTNYKMHKSKKGWLVSYSLLTFMLGGIYLGSSSTAPVKAADIDNQKDQKGVDQDLQKTVESKSLEDAKLNASTTINTEATTIKEKINSDLNLSSSKKAQQVKKVDALVTAAKTKVDAAANLADVKAVIEETVSNIDNAYEPGSVVTKAKSTAKKSTKKAPIISKNVKPASKKVGVTTYKGLSSFFKSASTSNGVTATNDNSAAAAATTAKTDKSEATSSLVADSAANSATDSAKIAANNATTNTKVEGTSDNKAADKRSTNDVTAQDEATPRIDTAADTDGGKAVAVGNDPDGGRNKFETDLNNPAGKTKTSVDVPVPDQVTHPEKYNQDATQVATVADFIKAWNTATTSYINVTSDLTFSASDRLATRSANAKDIVINGNGHTIDLQRQNFALAPTTAANPTTITLTNATFKQGLTDTGDYSSLISSSNGAGLQVNIDNINLLSNYPDGSQYGPNHVLYAPYAGIKFSGNNHFDLMNEVTRSVTYIEYANNSYVKMTRRPGTADNYKYSEFWVNVRDTTGRGNKLIMGDGSTNDASTASGISANYPAYYDYIGGMTVGDNVTWKQTGFQYFVDANREAGYFQDARFDFGENFTLSAPVTVQDGVIKLGYRQQANFAAGTKMEVNQNAIGAIFQVNGTSSINFISPKALHLAMFNAAGNPVNQYSGIFTGTGTVSLNDSSISTWNATNVGPNSPDNTAIFTQMSYQNGTVTLKDLDGKQVSGSKIVSNNTRELQTNAISVGTMSVQYVDQFGKVISTVKVPVTDKDNFIGQSVPFITKEYAITNMPKGYMWAIGNQVYSGAVKDPTVDTIDQYGQAKYGIVPMRTDTSDTKPDKTYTIYVYGTPQKVSYQYVDYKTNRVLTSPLSGKTGTEAVGGITPANYGNTIDWTNKYYKTDNVPVGYHYSTQAATDGKQPTTTQVTDNNPLVTIFVEGNEQTIPVSFVNTGNTAVTPVSSVTVTGVTGQTITVPEAPEAINSQLDHIELNGKTVKAGDTFEMPDQTNLPADQKYSLKYVYGPLDKSGALNELEDKYNKLTDPVTGTIAVNKDLTKDQKDAVKELVDKAYNAARAKINEAATYTPSLVENAKNSGIAAMEKAYEDGIKGIKPLSEQKTDAYADIEAVYKETVNNINNDPTLTQAVKNDQLKAASSAHDAAITAIDNAQDADAVNTAVATGKPAIENSYQPGTALSQQITDAKKIIAQAYTDTAAKINGDPTLSKDQKAAQLKTAGDERDTANAAIDAAKTADAINSAVATGKPAIENSYQPGTALSQQITDAKKIIAQAYTDTAAKINGDPTLSKDQKAAQLKTAGDERDTANAAIDAAKTADAINSAVATGKPAIENSYQPGTALSQQITDAKKIIAQAYTDTAAKINGDPTLSKDQKAAQLKTAGDERDKANAAIDAAKTADAINSAVATGKPAIENSYQPGTDLSQQITDAKKIIAQAYTDTAAKINGDPTLSKDQKAAQLKTAGDERDTANAAIDAAKTADAINSAVATGKPAIENSYQPGTDLSQQITDAKKIIAQAYTDTAAKINGDPTLSKDQKAAQLKTAGDERDTANAAIDAAKTADAINSAVATGKPAIENSYQPGTDLSQQITDAKKIIAQAYTDTAAKINGDPTLSKDQKAAQLKTAGDERDKANAAIDAAKTADAINSAVATGKPAIENSYQPGTDLSQQITDAKKIIAQAYTDTAAKINGDPTLSKDQKAAQLKTAGDERDTANAAIDAAKTADAINSAVATGKPAIENSYQPGTDLSQQITDAKKIIAQAYTDTAAKINGDPTLSKDQKAAQLKTAGDERDKANAAIDAAKTADAINSAVATGKPAIENSYQPGTDLSQQITDAKKIIAQAYTDTAAKINGDPTLSKDQKAAQLKTAGDERDTANAAIDAAKTADAINSAVATGKPAIENSYQPGTDLSQQITDAKKIIAQAYTDTAAKINGDPTLSKDQKAAQLKTAGDERDKANAAIDAAKTADAINSAVATGKPAIENSYQPGTDLSQQITDAKKIIAQAYTDTAAKINGDPTLSKDQKAAQLKTAGDERDTANAAIDAAKTADAINSAVATGKPAIENSYQPGTDLSQQITDAKKIIAQAYTDTAAKINGDPTLSKDQKAAQLKTAGDERDTANAAIDAAKTADAINSAVATGKPAIENSYQPGTDLSQQITDAKKIIAQAYTDTAAKINGDPTLSKDQKAAQLKTAGDERDKANAAIDAAKTADAINSAVATGKPAIENSYLPGTDLSQQITDAKKIIAQAYTDTAAKINGDPTLSKDQKAAQLKTAGDERDTANAAIDAAKTADAINSAVATGKPAIENSYQPGTDLSQQITDAKKIIAQAYTDTAAKINGDPTLSKDQKAAQLKTAGDERDKANAAIDAAKTADAINSAVATGKPAIENSYQPGTDLSQQITDAKKIIAQAYTDTAAKINGDPTLSKDQKAAQLKTAGDERDTANAAIDAAKTADAINSAVATGKPAIENSYQPGTALSQQITDAKKIIAQAYTDTAAKINGDPTLSKDQKAAQLKTAGDERDTANAAIDAAKTADAINSAVATGKPAIENSYQPGTDLSQQITDAKKIIAQAYTDTAAKINGDPTLSKDQKAAQLKTAGDERDTANAAIDAAKTADAINSAVATGKPAIENSYQPGTDLSQQITDAKKIIAQAYTDTAAKINGDPTLSKDQKAAQLKTAGDERDTANAAIDAAKTADAINSAVATGKPAIENSYQPGTDLSQQITDAKKIIAQAYTDTAAKINGDPTLSKDQKAAQLKTAGDERDKANAAIDAAKTADAINSAVATGKPAIENSYQPGTDLSQQITDAKKIIAQAYTDTAAKINGDPTLSKDQKAAQLKTAGDERDTANAAIDAAKTADAINSAVATGKPAIENSYQPGTDLSQQITDAKKIIAQAYTDTAAKINGDPTLSKDQKAAQLKTAGDERDKANAAIDAAKTADAINSAVATGKPAIEKAYQPGTKLDDQMQTAKDKIDQIATQVKGEIDKDPTLTTSEKTAQKAKVDSDAQIAKGNIDKAADAQGILDALNAGEEAIRNDHVPNTTSLEDQKKIAKDKIDQKAVEIKNAIDNDETLTTAEKTKQKAKVDTDATIAKQNIEDALNAQGVEDARNDGIKQIESDHVSNTVSLPDQKQTAKDKIDQEAVNIKNDIDNDDSLTTAEKSKQKAKVDSDAKIAKTNIDNAENAQEVKDELKAGITAIDNDHVPNTASLDEQKQTAKDRIDQEAVNIKKDIDNDETLTSSEKAAQKAKVDADSKVAKDKIDTAANAQGVKDELKAGITAIDDDHQPGAVTLDEQKQTAKDRIDQEAKLIKNSITTDPTLTNEEKAAQKAQVDADAKAAKDKIDTAANAQTVINETNNGITVIDNDYVPSDTSLDDQKQDAKDRIDEEALKIKGWIAKDPTLDDKTKAEQAAAVDAAATSAKQSIDTATNAQGVKNSRDRGITIIDSKYVSNPFTLAEQKEYAKQLIRDEAEIVKAAINSDPVLDDKTKADQVKAVEAQAQKAIDRIDGAVNAQAVQVEYAKGITALHAQHLSGTDLDSQKKDAKDKLDQEAATITGIINKDTSLDESARATQIANVDSELQKAKNAIDRAKTSQEISDKEVAGVNAIDAQYVPGKSLPDQKASAAKALDDAAAAAKDKIAQSKNVTPEDKAKANQAVDDAVNSAKSVINAAQDAQGISQAVSDGINAINAVVKANSAADLKALKQNAKDQIATEAAAIEKAISADPTLTNDEKQVQISNVKLEADKATNAIDRAVDAQEVADKQAAGIAAIDAQYIPGKSIADQKNAAVKAIDDAATAAKDKIAQSKNVTDAQKAKANQAIDDAAAKGKETVRVAVGSDEISKAISDSAIAINDVVKANSAIELAGQKQSAKDSIDDEALIIRKRINSDASLTAAEKSKQIANVDLEANKAKNAIDRAEDAATVNSKMNAGVEAIDAQYIPGKPFESQKSDAIQAITDAATAAKDKVDKDQSKTAAEKTKEKQAIDDAAAAAKDSINKAKDAEDINNGKAAGIAGIDVAQKPVITLDDQKQAAKDAIDAAANAAKNKISQDLNLTNEQKAAANKAVDDAAAAAKDAVDKATDADGIEKAKSDGTANVTQITTDADNQAQFQKDKTVAKGQIKQMGEDAKEAIDGSKLSDSDKKAAKDKIDQAVKEFQDKADAAKTNGELLIIQADASKVINSIVQNNNGSGSNGSDSNGSGSNGSGSNGSGSNGSDSNGSGSNGSGSNGSDSNGSGSNGSGSNGSGSNGSDSNGSGSNGSGSNGSDSNGSGSNGSGSNGSDSNGSGSNGSGSNGSDSNGSGSNGSGSNGSGSNGSDSNGSGSNGSGSNGSGSNGSGSNGSDSNGSGSNGSGSNGSDSNGSGSNGSGSNGSDSNGSGSNGSGSNGSDSNGSGSNSSGSNGSGSNGSDSNGSGSNGSDSNGSGSNGSGSNGSGSNGSDSNGSGSNGSGSNGSDSNGSGSNGSGSNGSGSNGSGSNGSDSNGSGSNGSGSNGSGSNGSGSNGSDSNGSGSNGSGSNGSGSNGSGSNGSGSNGSGSNGSGSNGSGSNGSGSNGSGSNGSGSNGSDSNGSGSNGSGSNGSDSNGSGSNGSGSNGSDSNGSGSNGSGSNGSDSNGSGSNSSGSNGSGSNGSDSNGSGSNGSDSNGSGSNGSGSNGSGSNGSDSNGSGSNGSGSNGSDSNGSGSNGSGSNGSGSNGSGSNGSGSNGSDSNGSGSNGSGSNGSGSNGSGSNGSGSNGSGSNGSGSNGSGSNGSGSNGSGSNGSGSNGSGSNGSDSNGSGSNGSGSNGSDSNGSGSNGSGSNGSGSNGSDSNGSGSNGSGSNGSDSNGSDSNGSGSNGSGSNGSDSNGSGSNGSGSNGSGSNGSDSNGSDSNGSGSNGSGSNGSGSNGSGSNGSGSNGSGSNGSDSNGSGSNGSGSNGSGSNGSDSNGSGSNGSGSNGSDSNGSGSNGSDSNGSGSNGSGSNGSGSNGSGSNGSGSNGSGSNGSDSNGSGSNGSGSNGSGSNGSDSNGSGSNGSGSNGSDSNGSGSNGSGSNGSGSNGSDSNGSGSNGSGSNGSDSNGSGSNGSGSNGSGSNGSDSNGSGSNGSDSNGSGSNGSDSNGSGSNGSDSNGSGSNGSGSNGSGSNGSGSNGSGSNGSGSNGSGSNGSGSNGSGSNGSGSNGSGSNGSGSNGSGSNGSGSNGSGSNGSGSNGSDSNGSGSNGSGSNGSGSNGSGSNGSDSNGSGSNGSGSNGSDSNGSGSNGSGSNGSGSNGSDSNGSGSNGSGSNGSGSNGSGSNGSGSNGSGSNGSGSNGSGSSSQGSTSTGGAGATVTGSTGSDSATVTGSTGSDSATGQGTAAETAGAGAGADAAQATDRKLKHNAYFYDKDGKRANLLVAKKGSTISTFGEATNIGGREFYLTNNGLYVAANNFKEQKRTLKHNAFVYNQNGKRVGTKLLKKNSKVGTYGDPVSIHGKSYYIVGTNRYVKAANFKAARKEANNVIADGVTSNAVLEHDAYVYNGDGRRINQVVLKAGSKITAGNTKTIDGRQFVEIANGQYVASDNVTGTARKLTTKAAIYNKYGNKTSKPAMKKGETVQTYGDIVVIKGKAYYAIGNDEFIKQTAFE
ncbi:DUF1542 domain-containing protein [Lactobacillus panisapium]|uniref:DUF1542 domain-containing protein n=1 Tax=Lactobacillus panisapium TaxID=2012495 RepID=UPI001C6A81F5|nr:DUF1542 domain-containing protein [Lactobacillus panisapium]QYN59042.1 DUF1542 domain-containing protein [Lactobacillus panisapium]